MYKVFINEKRLIISNQPESTEHNIIFTDEKNIEEGIELLEKTSAREVCVYASNIDKLWKCFKSLFHIVEAAGGLVANKEGKILFIHRLGKWDLPKGKLEKGEGVKEAAVREVEEETGITDLELLDFLQETYHIYTEKKKRILKRTYWFTMKYNGSEVPSPQIEEGISKVEWKSHKEIQERIYPQTFKNIQLLINLYFRLNNIV
ncbi:NUDIX domain-containing protein [Riemerella anatipestifer]|uniref:NUDIX hydrolase n=1 Tax=Riemerella anatipestifer TaxID=34085 RepID=UPI00129D51E2|nr:NUDIX domain-containing protein [Riemerella anatipestifer]MRN15373.1 NUDIX domain-containing protein [Riemerella anatipestifer]